MSGLATDKKNRILFSVIIPVYNVKSYLRKCLDSVLSQTYKELEIIIVDDGSNDGSTEICDEYKKNHNQIILIKKENEGLSAARNQGIDIATGDYIAFIDSDDYVSEYLFEDVAQVIQEHKTQLIAIKQPVMFWDGDEPKEAMSSHTGDFFVSRMDSKEALKQMFFSKIATGAQFKIVKKELLFDIRFPYGFYFEDLATTYKLFLQVRDVSVLAGALYAYRKRRDSIIRQEYTEKKDVIIEIANRVVEDIDNRCPDLSFAVRCRFFASLYSVFLQMPQTNNSTRETIWKMIKEYRYSVQHEAEFVRKKDYLAMLVSFLGKDVAYYLGNRYGRKDTFRLN